jgi:hypothetical protein
MTGALPLAGWYPHPASADFWCYWDGSGWTPHTAPRYVARPIVRDLPRGGRRLIDFVTALGTSLVMYLVLLVLAPALLIALQIVYFSTFD